MASLPYMRGVKALHDFRTSGDLGRSHNANAVVQRKNGQCFAVRGQACHGGLGNPPGESKDVKFIISGIQKKSDGVLSEEEGLTYLNWLMNTSMYARCFVTKDASWCFENEAIVLRPDIEANFLMSALQSTRRLWEYTYVPKVFSQFVGAGVIPELALFLAHNVGVTDGNKMAFMSQSSDHYPIASAAMTAGDLLAFMKGEPSGQLNPLWSKNPRYSGVQALFRRYKGVPIFDAFLKDFKIEEKVKAKPVNPFLKAKKATEGRKYYLISSVAEEVVKNLQPKILEHIGYAKDISG